jgi:hypothetical protein
MTTCECLFCLKAMAPFTNKMRVSDGGKPFNEQSDTPRSEGDNL